MQNQILWAVKGDYTASCSCKPACCSCNFGFEPILGNCDGSGLLEIKEGYYGDVGLDGISLVMIHEKGEVGKPPRIKHYVSEKATDQQHKAATQLFEAVFAVALPMDLEILPSEKVSIWIERSNETIKFSVPTFGVEIEIMKGQDGGSIGIEEPLGPWAMDYKQYKSTYSATNAYTAKWDISSN